MTVDAFDLMLAGDMNVEYDDQDETDDARHKTVDELAVDSDVGLHVDVAV